MAQDLWGDVEKRPQVYAFLENRLLLELALLEAGCTLVYNPDGTVGASRCSRGGMQAGTATIILKHHSSERDSNEIAWPSDSQHPLSRVPSFIGAKVFLLQTKYDTPEWEAQFTYSAYDSDSDGESHDVMNIPA